MPGTFADGVSKTILFTEKYANCKITVTVGMTTTTTAGGTRWADWYASSSNYFPAIERKITAESGNDFGYTQTPFQSQPLKTNCDPFLASTGHPAVINVCMGDGSVKSVVAEISSSTWFSACTPDWGDVIGTDWGN